MAKKISIDNIDIDILNLVNEHSPEHALTHKLEYNFIDKTIEFEQEEIDNSFFNCLGTFKYDSDKFYININKIACDYVTENYYNYKSVDINFSVKYAIYEDYVIHKKSRYNCCSVNGRGGKLLKNSIGKNTKPFYYTKYLIKFDKVITYCFFHLIEKDLINECNDNCCCKNVDKNEYRINSICIKPKCIHNKIPKYNINYQIFDKYSNTHRKNITYFNPCYDIDVKYPNLYYYYYGLIYRYFELDSSIDSTKYNNRFLSNDENKYFDKSLLTLDSISKIVNNDFFCEFSKIYKYKKIFGIPIFCDGNIILFYKEDDDNDYINKYYCGHNILILSKNMIYDCGLDKTIEYEYPNELTSEKIIYFWDNEIDRITISEMIKFTFNYFKKD